MKKSQSKTFMLGVTGCLGMGKSTTATLFEKFHIPVWDADRTVHDLYRKGNKGYWEIKKTFPEFIDYNGVNRKRISEAMIRKPSLIKKIEFIIHPLVREDRSRFIKRFSDQLLIVFDIPLLFETNAQRWLNAVLVVTAPKILQKKRVLSRTGMTEEKMMAMMSRQMSNEEKLERANYVLKTDVKLAVLETQVERLIGSILKHE
jgi:dephospho-CoA kinase